MTTKKEHNEKLVELINQFEKYLTLAETYAKEHDLEFSISPAYGMGGHYGKIESEWQSDATGFDIGEFAWYASSQSC